MKWMIASDIHGSAHWCEKMLARFEAEKADRLLLLGDLLYHGPRNDLPEGYAPKSVIALLNGMKEKILCVRGNCEAEVDQMVLSFPVMAEYAVLPAGNNLIYAAHGHHAGETAPPPLCPGDILLCGHTHIPRCAVHENFVYLNPGSVSIPKENSAHGYMIFEDDTFTWKDIESGNAYMQFRAGSTAPTSI
ncbi:MAG: phosphodiesterase [Clostridiales bacterium]|nr:phosphodiesterase [Clostridiales bacterium]